MSTSTIRIDDGIKEETTRIAARLGLTFNGVVNILLRKFNEEKGFPFAVRLEDKPGKSVFDMDSAEFEGLCREAVANREDNPSPPFVMNIDGEGRVYKRYGDGRTEYVLK